MGQKNAKPAEKKDESKTNLIDKHFDKIVRKTIEGQILQTAPLVSFSDIAGLAEAKQRLQEAIVLPMEFPEIFKGIRSPVRGICMFGPPGTGKTMLAKAVASECRTTFFNISPADMTSKYWGDSAKLVKRLFDTARARAPSTIFIDEIDSLCTKRGGEYEHEESRKAKAELLMQMDGLSSNTDEKMVLVLAATNFPWELDESLRRRFEKRIYIPLPDYATRLALLNSLLVEDQNIKLSEDVRLEEIARKLEGYSGSDTKNICRDAAMAPVRDAVSKSPIDVSDLTIQMTHFDVAIQNIMPSVSKLNRYVEWKKEYGAN